MTKIPVIRVTHRAQFPSSSMLAIMLSLGIVVGVFIGERGSFTQHIPNDKLTANVGSSLDSAAVPPIQPTTDLAQNEEPLDQPNDQPLISPQDTTTNSDMADFREITTALKDKEIIRGRLINEINILKQNGIAIVSRFHAECNDWLLPCGQLFTEELNKNNEFYARNERLLREIESAINALAAQLP